MKAIILFAIGCLLVSAVLMQEIRITKVKAKVEEAENALLVVEARLDGEREAYQQAMQLAASVRDSEARMAEVASRLNLAVASLGEQHAKDDPCFYAIPDTSTLGRLHEATPYSPP